MAQWLNGSMAQWLKVCLLALLGAVATEAYSFDVVSLAGDTKENRYIYIDEDAKGRLFRHKLTYSEREGYQLHREFVSDEILQVIEADGFTIRVVAEGKKPVQSDKQPISAPRMSISYGCPIPSDFWIGGWYGVAFGNRICYDTSRPAGTTTQTISFEFETINYRGQHTHNPIVPFFKDALHGWGAFFGDNHLSSAGCGSNALFNSQIEGWAQLPNAGCTTLNCANNWQSKTFNGSNSCGNEMVDNQLYRMTLHANTDKWVYYEIEKKINGIWQSHTSPRVLSVLSEPWPQGLPTGTTLDILAKGIAVLSSEPSGHNWYIHYSNFNVGWI